MLATLAALHLLLVTQTAPGDLSPPEGNPPPPSDAQQPPQQNPPLPRKPGTAQQPGQEPGAAPPAEPAPGTQPPGYLPPPRTIPAAPKQVSLLSGESLQGGAAALAQAGWSQLSLQFAQGITSEDDLGGLLELDWATTELKLGAFYRRPLGPAGPFTMGGRLGIAYYNDFGKTYIYGSNHKDHGFEIAPSLSLSERAGGGIFSIIGEVPFTVTTKGGAGLLFRPRASLAYEAPLYDELTLGARIGVGYRAGAGDAPISGGRAELMFLIVGGYRLF